LPRLRLRSVVVKSKREQGNKGYHGDGANHQSAPFQPMHNVRTDCRNRPRLSFEVRIANPLRVDNSILKQETLVADLDDDAGAYFSVWQVAVNIAMLVYAEFLNGELVAGLFRCEHNWRPWEAAALGSLGQGILIGIAVGFYDSDAPDSGVAQRRLLIRPAIQQFESIPTNLTDFAPVLRAVFIFDKNRPAPLAREDPDGFLCLFRRHPWRHRNPSGSSRARGAGRFLSNMKKIGRAHV